MSLEPHERDEQIATVAARMNAQPTELMQRIETAILDAVPALSEESLLEFLRGSIQENVVTALHVLQYAIDLSEVSPPAAAIAYARRLAQRAVPLTALLQAYRVGHVCFLRLFIEELMRHVDTSCVEGPTILNMVLRSDGYVHLVVNEVIVTYEQAQREWFSQRNAALASAVQSVLQERSIEVSAAESKLNGYRLRQWHLGFLVWSGKAIVDGGPERQELRDVADALGQAADCRERPLFVGRDESSGWIWLPLGERTAIAADALELALQQRSTEFWAGMGELGFSMDGFRRTHRQACLASRVALVADPPRKRMTSFTEVAPIAPMCADLEATRDWVAETLGALAIDDERHAALRETARVFLAAGGSYAAVAEQLNLHRNTVHYRISKAEELRGRPLREDHLKVELALLACRWLGSSVLRAS